MPNMQERQHWRSTLDQPHRDRDLPLGWQRDLFSAFLWHDPDGRTWRFVPRRRIRRIVEADRRDALVVKRFRHGYVPRTIEGAVIRAYLESPRTMRLDLLLGYLGKWDDDPWAFFLRGFADDRALLTVVLRTDRDER